MDRETLNRFRTLHRELGYLKKEIEAEYYSVHAIRYDGIKYSSPDLRGSTLRALEKIEEKQELYNRLLTEYVEIWDLIDEWFEELDDLLAESIVRCYYMMGKSWNETGRIVYEKNHVGETCRQYIYRLLKKRGEEGSRRSRGKQNMNCLFTAKVMQTVRSRGLTTSEIQKMKLRIIHLAEILQQNEFQFTSDLGINLNILLIGDRMFIHTKADRLDAQEYFWMEQDGTWRTVPSDQIRYL